MERKLKCHMPYCDQPAQMCRLISYFVVHFLDCNVIVSISKILSHYVPDTIIAEFTNTSRQLIMNCLLSSL